MAHDQRQREGADIEGGGFGGRDAKAVHAGVDVERRAGFSAVGLGGLPVDDFGQGIEDRAKVVGDQGFEATRQDAAENVDVRLGRDLAKPYAFFRQRHEERAAARPGQRGAGLLQPDAVGVCLDDRRGLAGDLGRDGAPVRDQRREVDGEAGARGHGGFCHGDRSSAPGPPVRLRLRRTWRKDRSAAASRPSRPSATCISPSRGRGGRNRGGRPARRSWNR